MQGLGNDYVYIDGNKSKDKRCIFFNKIIGNRNWGIGSDGLILIDKKRYGRF